MASIPYPTPARSAVPRIFQLKIRAIWRYLTTQPASFWFINIYLFFEYVRPQSIYTWLDILPWTQASILLSLGALVLEGKLPRFRTIGAGLLLVFSAVVFLSSVTAVFPSIAMSQWELYFSWVLIFLLITNIVTTEKRFFVFMLAFLLYSFKMSQHAFRSWALSGFAFRSWGATGGPGWFHNSGEFGIQMCVFLPLVVEFILALRKNWNKWVRWFFYFIPVTAVASMVASSSRGALVGGAMVGLWYVIRSKHRFRTLLIVALLGAATWQIVPEEQKARFEMAGEDRTSTKRLDRWEWGLALAAENPVLGIGYANWQPYFSGQLSHNVFIEAMSELGYTGLLVFIAMIIATFVINYKTRRLLKGVPTSTPFMRHMAYGLDGALIGFIGSGFFVTVLYYPYFWINLAMTVSLHVSARNERRRLLRAARTNSSSAPVPDQVRPWPPRTVLGA